ncbi:hypothetical protein [Streptomyces sp. NPDC056707]|uniref:hypothetical protein n=1 Tax=Streptomyces sp. NPDC056707 TaxID=3345919 RepID=UPI0036B33E54
MAGSQLPTVPAVVATGDPCTGISRVLQSIEVPLQLIADGGTPVTFVEDLQAAGRQLQGLSAASPEPVKSYASGLSGDLLALVAALDAKENGAAVQIGDVVTNRVRNLRHACTRP